MTQHQSSPLDLVILIYPGMTLLDAIGPMEILAISPHLHVRFASFTPNTVLNDHQNIGLTQFTDANQIEACDILLIPGGGGDQLVRKDEEILNWIKKIDQTTRHTVSVCTGSLILAQAGLLKGRQASSHWAYLNELKSLGAHPKRQRYTVDGKYITAAGVSAGIDMSLYLLQSLFGKKHAKSLQFGIEYFPKRFDLLTPYSLPKKLLHAPAKIVRKAVDTMVSKI